MDGLLLADKPSGCTSHDVVRRARALLGQRRVGHAGTLDPFATGLVALLVGRATRLSRWLTALDKTYSGLIRLGQCTDTGDRDGRPLGPRQAVRLAPGAAAEAARRLEGHLDQVPHPYSAKKVGGRRAYRLAREGRAPSLEPVRIHVRSFEVGAPGGDGSLLPFRVHAGSGTYVRSLAEELGRLLGCGAHLEALRRERVGPLRVEEALGLDGAGREEVLRALRPPEAIPLGLPDRRLDAAEAEAARHGRPLPAGPAGSAPEGAELRLLGEDGRLIGVGRIEAAGASEGLRLRPRMVLEGAEKRLAGDSQSC